MNRTWNTGLAARAQRDAAQYNLKLKLKKKRRPGPKAASVKRQATSGKPTPGGGGEKAFYKKVLDIRSGII